MIEEFVAPCWKVTLGQYALARMLSLDVWSQRDNPMDRAEVLFDPRGIEDRKPFAKGAPVAIGLGYIERGIWPVFAGEISVPIWQDEAKLILLGKAEALRRTRINRTFVDAGPQEIVRAGLAAAGITSSVLGSRTYPVRHLFVAANLTVIQLIRLVARTWEIDWPWFCDAAGVFYWCPWKDTGRGQGDRYTLEYGVNILDLAPPDAGGRGRLTTMMLPFLRHSDLINIEDPRYWQASVTVIIEKVHHRFDKSGGRTCLEWTLV